MYLSSVNQRLSDLRIGTGGGPALLRLGGGDLVLSILLPFPPALWFFCVWVICEKNKITDYCKTIIKLLMCPGVRSKAAEDITAVPGVDLKRDDDDVLPVRGALDFFCRFLVSLTSWSVVFFLLLLCFLSVPSEAEACECLWKHRFYSQCLK